MVPVTIITGFLGAGKTTLLNYILTQPHGKRIAVIENEVADGLGIESAIAKDGTDVSSLQGFYELANGCICCSTKSDLLATLELLVERKSSIDYILIETSGMAHPGPVASCLWVDDALESQLYLDGIITVVDAKHIRRHLPPPYSTTGTSHGNHEEKHPEEALQQLAFADRVLVNKSDLVQEEELVSLEGVVRSINGLAQVQRSSYGKVDLDFLLGIGGYAASEALRVVDTTTSTSGCNHHHHDHDGGGCHGGCGEDHDHEAGVTTVAVVEEVDVVVEKVRRWLAELLWNDDDSGGEGRPPDHGERMTIYRMKGLLWVAGESRPYILQAVHETFEVDRAQGGSSISTSSTSGGERVCKVVVIGKGLQESVITAGLRACAPP